ncbi:MAG: hydrolase [Planctomycetes bacterium]|jgi:nicotinamidase-related amidase|nr:hydrolase [Planctomycetota bacterium]
MVEMLAGTEPFLVVIDVQGKLAEIVHDSGAVRRNVRRLIEGAKLFGLPIVATEQVPESLGATVPEVTEALGDLPRLTKTTFSCWRDPGIRAAFEATGRRTAILCGIEAHVCVWQTAADLLNAGWRVFAAADAVSSRVVANRDLALSRLRDGGAVLTSTEMALFEMQEHCEGKRFRSLLRLVR